MSAVQAPGAELNRDACAGALVTTAKEPDHQCRIVSEAHGHERLTKRRLVRNGSCKNSHKRGSELAHYGEKYIALHDGGRVPAPLRDLVERRERTYRWVDRGPAND
eukprot:6208954-Pleurochrysis_carterae.AAC.1